MMLRTSTKTAMELRRDDKQLYEALTSNSGISPIFFQPWWLDATAGSEFWDVVVIELDGAVSAVLPYILSERRGFRLIGQPALTQFLGPWLKMDGVSQKNVLSRQKVLLSRLVDALPEFDYYSQNWSRDQQNWLPFYWKGFSQTTYYTYVIPDISDLEKVWKGFQANIKTDVRKAQGRFNLTVRTDLDIDDFLALNAQVFQRQGKAVPYTADYVRRLDAACVEHNSRKIFIAEDADGRRHAGVYIVWDRNSAYYLMGGGDPELRNSGATSLCMWEAIKFASTVTRQFDFEGSMLEPVERFFRAFGAEQRPYFNVSKNRSRLLKIYFFLQDLRKKII